MVARFRELDARGTYNFDRSGSRAGKKNRVPIRDSTARQPLDYRNIAKTFIPALQALHTSLSLKMSTWQKLGTCVSLFVSVTVSVSEYLWLCHMPHFACHMSHCACHIAHVTCHMSNAYVDSLDMLNNFCFDVYAQKWGFVTMSHVTFRMSQCACHMSYVKCLCLCWFLGHAEQLLFSCLCSKVSICDYVTCHMSHVACHMSYVRCLSDPWDIMNNFCFHVYAQMSLFMGVNVNGFFFYLHTLACDQTNHRTGSQLKMLVTGSQINYFK